MTARRSPSPPAPSRARLPAVLAWLIPLVAALALVAWDASARIRKSLELSGHYGVAVRAPAPDVSSPTGYALGRRSLIPPVSAPDAMHWVMQTQAMAAEGNLRVRHVDYDNAPDGRAVHWAAPYRWWLIVLANTDRVLTGAPLPLAIERSALWAGPVLFGLGLIVLGTLSARNLGAIASGVISLGLATNASVSAQFAAGNADHHGAVILCALASVLLLVGRRDLGAKGTPARPIASAIVAAVGLWLSATTMIPVLLGIGLGAACAQILCKRAAGPETHVASHWRTWGMVGGGTTLLAWILEYAPVGSGWRLEVIHPLHAVAWLAGGEFLHRIAAPASEGREARPRRQQIPALVVCAVIAALPGLVIAAWGSEVYLPLDPLLLRLHAQFIAEFQSLPRLIAERGLDLAVLGMLGPIFLLIGGTALALRARAGRTALSLWCCAGPAVLLAAAACVQIRWLGLAGGLSLVAAAVALSMGRESERSGSLRVLAWAAGILLLLPGTVGALRAVVRADTPAAHDIRMLALRDVAHRLRLHVGDGALVIAAPPESTSQLIYFAGARGIGTLYWENHAGLARQAAFFGDAPDESALSLAQTAGITHVVIPSWDPGAAFSASLHRAVDSGTADPTDTLVRALSTGRPPDWLKPVAHRLPDHPLLRQESILIYEVAPARTPEQVAVDTAVFLMDMGRFDEAAAYEPTLRRISTALSAQSVLAMLQARRRDARGFSDTLARIIGLLPLADDTGPLDEHIRTVSVLAIGGETARATTQLRRALAAATESSIRSLSPGALGDLRALVDALQVPMPSPALEQLIVELDMRAEP